MRKIKVVLLLVRQLQHGFTKNAKVSPNLTVAHIIVVLLYYKIGNSYLCSAKAPVLEGYGSRRLYLLKGTSVDSVYVVFGARVLRRKM